VRPAVLWFELASTSSSPGSPRSPRGTG